MSRYRNIHCLIWNDDKFPFASDACQLVFFHLITTPLSSPFGLYKASLEALAAEKRWDVKAYREAFQEAFQKGFVKYDERAQVILLPHFLKYNPPGNPNVLKAWGKLFEEIPASALKNECYQYIKDLAKGISKAFLKAFEEGFAKPMPIQEQEQEQNTGTGSLSGRGFSKAAPARAQEEDGVLDVENTTTPRVEAVTDAVMSYVYTVPVAAPSLSSSGHTPPADFTPTAAMLEMARKDAPHVNLDLVTKMFRATQFTRAVLDWPQRWYKFVLEEEARAPTHRNGAYGGRGGTSAIEKEQRTVQNAVELAKEVSRAGQRERPLLQNPE